jgi:FkbM family methyltransferase
MKVLLISVFPPDPAPEAVHAVLLSEHLSKSGLDVHILCKKGSGIDSRENIVVHPVIDDWSWSDLPRLVKCIRRCQPDIILLIYIGWVYNHNPMITFLPTICKKILPGVPCVTQFENVDTLPPYRSLRVRVLRKVVSLWAGRKNVDPILGTLLRDSSLIIALSSPHRDSLANLYSEVAEKSVILPPPPLIRFCSDQPASVRERARKAIGAREDDFVWIYWGYIYPGKGVETLLHAFRIACQRNANLRLVLVGGCLEFPTEPISCSDYFRMVQQLPERLNISERVTWTGNFNWDSEEGSEYLHAGDACVLPLDYGVTLNNSSLAAASTHGLPVIGTELLEGRDEMLEHGRNIYLCQPQDPEMLAESIELITESADLRERLRNGVRDLARKWHRWDTLTERLVAILQSAVSDAEIPGNHLLRSKESPEAESRKQKESSEIRALGHEGEFTEIQANYPQQYSSAWSEEKVSHETSAPHVSVVVAVHNVEKYLSQCLDSLVNQTLTNIEIIVVNDASTDKSLAILKEYQSRHPNVRVIDCKNNIGLASVRNLGIRLSKGTYIGFVDGDDWVDIKMFEAMYRRIKDDNSDVLIADATVFYEDSKTFGKFFDQHIRQILDPQMKRVPFDLSSDSRILLLEPVAWIKLYKRSFLQEHGLNFEGGMNSYEDICFHFAVLLQATRISLTDDAFPFYRQNRRGQISGRTSRKIFEVFSVFDRIHETLVALDVSDDIWTMLIKVQLRQFDWLLKDRVQSHHEREFMVMAAKQLNKIPKSGLKNFTSKADPHELATEFYMRRNWRRAYKMVNRPPSLPLMYVMLYYRKRGIMKRVFQHCRYLMRTHVFSLPGRFLNKSFDHAVLEEHLQAGKNSVNHLPTLSSSSLRGRSGELLAEVFRINDQTLFFCDWSMRFGLQDAVWRMENDYYLTQTAALRRGDTVVDIGAHVGVISICLAKKFPFIKVYAIEPNPLNYACLKRNIEINEVSNVTAINKAVSGDARNRTLYADAWDGALATIDASMAPMKHKLRTMQVESVTMEDLFREYEIRHCRLLKMSALGVVLESLKGLARNGCVDLLCGEANLEECSRSELELESRRIARQHFWRTVSWQAKKNIHPWIHQMPTEMEQLPSPGKNSIHSVRG